VSELSRRLEPADPPANGPAKPPSDRSGQRVTADQRAVLDHLTGIAPRPDRAPRDGTSTGSGLSSAEAKVSGLKDRHAADKSDLAARTDAPERDAALEAANAKIAELMQKLDKQDADLDAARAKSADLEAQLDDANTRIETLNAKVDELHAEREAEKAETKKTLGDVCARLERLENPEPGKPDDDTALSRIDERTSSPETRDDRLSKPKKARGEMHAYVVEAAIANGGLVGAALAMGAQMPSYVTNVAAAAAGAAWATSKVVRKWRGERNGD